MGGTDHNRATKVETEAPILTLAYDGGCSFCTETAESIQKIANSKYRFNIVSLSEPWVRELLEENGLSFQPVILERSNGGWKIHRGVELAWRLIRALGPSTSWAVLKAIGQLRTSRSNGPSRGKFLAGLAGLATVTALPSPALADSDDTIDTPEWLSTQNSDPERLNDAEATRVADHFFSSAPGRKAESVLKEAVSHPDLAAIGPASDDTSITGTKFASKNGEMRSVIIRHPRAAFIYFVNDSKTGRHEYATVITPTAASGRQAGDTAEKLFQYSDGELWERPRGDWPVKGEIRNQAQKNCTKTSQCSGRCNHCQCVSIDLKCATNCCMGCSLSCGNPYSCIACLGGLCPACVALSKCCTKAVPP